MFILIILIIIIGYYIAKKNGIISNSIAVIIDNILTFLGVTFGCFIGGGFFFIIFIDFSQFWAIFSLIIATVVWFYSIWEIFFKKEKPLKPLNYHVNNELKGVNIGNKSATRFIFPNGQAIRINSINLTKIAYKVTEKYGRNSFKPGELSETYSRVVTNYETNFDTETYKKVLSITKRFVDEGGSVEIL